MAIPRRLVPLLAEYDFALQRLLHRLRGPGMDSGDGESVVVPPMTDAEYLWEPVPDCWSVRLRSDGPGVGAKVLVGAGEWGRDGGRPRPYPAPFTTIAWRLGHLGEMLTLRADWTLGSHSLTNDRYRFHGDAPGAIAALAEGAAAWRDAVTSADDESLDQIGRSQYPDGSDPDEPFIDVVWWVNQELLHHGAEIALLRDLYRARGV
jgi:hypothetical protein